MWGDALAVAAWTAAGALAYLAIALPVGIAVGRRLRHNRTR